MIDVGFWEVAMIGVMALIILGPERLPKVARTAGMWIGKARSMLREVKADIKTEMDATEITELKNMSKDIREAGEAFKSQVESADKNVKSQGSEMDSAITDALNKPADPPAVKKTEKSTDITTAKQAKKLTTKHQSSSKKTADKKPVKKKAAKKAVTKSSSKNAKKA